VADALLVIDVFNTFQHEDADKLLDAFRRRADGMVAAVTEARAAGVPVIYVNDANGRWDGDAKAHVGAAEQGRGGDVISRLTPAPGDRFIFKPRYSAFDHTPLALVLADLKVDRVLLAGAATEGCVVQSGIDARELGLKVTILVEACATVDEELEAVALAYAEHVAGMRIDGFANGAGGNHSDHQPSEGRARMPGKSAHVKNEDQYEALKDKGMSKERAAKIANSPGASSRGGKSSSRSSSTQGGTTAQKKAAGRKGGEATARKRS
jgi:nicotinamidase-related amidase